MSEWALITGASAGIGYELARLFAASHFNLVFVARNEARLLRLADELRAAHGIQVKVLPKDLSVAAAPREIFDTLRDTPISVLVNNAGFGWRGPFVEGDLQRSLDMMHVNMDSLVQLTHLFVQPMLSRHSGRILNVASVASYLPGPFMTIYYASKAFVYSFSCALAEELEGTGVTVTAFCPGPTQTEFRQRAGISESGVRRHSMNARTVAEIGYRGLMKGRRVVIPGAGNKISAALAKAVPSRLSARVARRLNEGR